MGGQITYSHPFKERHEDVIAARERAHAAFDPLWREGLLSFADAYVWLSGAMQVPRVEAHIGRFTPEQCDRVVELATKRVAKLRRKAGR